MSGLRVLFVEDNPLDAELAVRELQKTGFYMQWQRVDTLADFLHQLAHDPPDVIISDHAMPQFSSGEALGCLRESGLMIPFIVVSHAIGEEEAVQLIRKGAADYLLKDRMGRLGESVRHALEERQLRARYTEAQQELLRLNEGLEQRIADRTAELEVANRALARELSERKEIEERLRQLADTLEERVVERTQQLAASYDRLRALATDLTIAEQSERRKLATELHDYLAQLLVVTRMKVAELLRQEPEPDARAILRDADGFLHQALDYTRSLVSELTPQALYERGLAPALRWLGDQMRRQKLLNVEVSVGEAGLQLPEADAVLLYHSVRELLFNVLKHAKADRADISMTYTQNVLTLTVSDLGCGFDVEKLRNDRSDRFGLLSIRERMLALGGRFELQSETGKGTVASLYLPCAASGESPENHAAGVGCSADSAGVMDDGNFVGPGPRPRAAGKPDAAKRLRILIVDDHQLVRTGLHSLLKEHDDLAVVGEAENGEAALQLAGALLPDVVIMDMQMPGWNGAETTRRILQRHPAIVVIGLSIQTEAHVAQAMLDAGAAAFLPKEMIGTDLYNTIHTAVHGSPSSTSPSARPRD